MNQIIRGEVVEIAIAEIDEGLRPASQMRAHLDQDAIEDYAAHVDALPPVKLMFDRKAKCHWVIDGAHTITAAIVAGREDIPAIVSSGSYEEAWKEAARENEGHGVRITQEDRRVRLIRAAELFPDRKYEDYAKLCNVSQGTAWNVLNEFFKLNNSGQGDAPQTVIGKDGKQYPRTKPRQPRKEAFTCHQCGEEFDRPVWHCHQCGEHWPDSENVCPTCWNPDEVEESPSLTPDRPRKPLPGQQDLFDEDEGETAEAPRTTAREEAEQATGKWGQLVLNLSLIMIGVNRCGGFAVMCKGWSRAQIERHIKHVRATIAKAQELLDGLESLLA